jgi:hypothetical protein
MAVEKLSIMKKNNCLRVSFLVFLAAGISMTASATVGYYLNITEVSDTTLTYSFEGGSTQTVASSPSDQWSFTLPLLVGTTTGSAAWTEPDNSAEYNIITVTPIPASGLYTVTVDSDASNPNAYPVEANGASAMLDNIDVTFHDDGDTAVPDGGSTGILLGIGLASLVALRQGMRQFASAYLR